MEVGSFNINTKSLRTHTVYTVAYKPEFFPIYQWQFLELDKAVAFASEKTESDKKLFKRL